MPENSSSENSITPLHSPEFHQHESYFKTVNDPVHGHIHLDQDQLRFIDTPQFQRLRNLMQLGSAYFVFPGASHKRFEHSIGVSYLAEKMVAHLKSTQPSLDITNRDLTCVKLAGLCHDLGHGPFSHIFDREFIPLARGESGWHHEIGSEMLLDYLIDDNGIEISTEDVKFIKSLIQGEPVVCDKEKAFLYDVVANKRNSIDVDKFDYLQRDCYNVGIKSSYDYERLILFSRVSENQICFSHKEIYNIYEMFHTRYSLFKRVYTHKVGKAVELMIVDALMAADKHLKISDSIYDPEAYMYLTDSIISDIEKSKNDELLEARNILKRLRKRQLYKFADQYPVPAICKDYYDKEKVNSDLISRFSSGLTANDIILDWNYMNYGMKGDNPVNCVKFYGKYDQDTTFYMKHDELNYLVPEKFEELTLRVYARDPEKVPAVQEAFRSFMLDFNDALGTKISPEKFADSNEVSPAILNVISKGDTVPSKLKNEKAWQRLVEARSWSPGKETVASKAKVSKETVARKREELKNEFEDCSSP